MTIRLLASTARRTNTSKRSRPSRGHRFMPRPAKQHGDATLDACSETLPLPERPTLLISFSFRCLSAPTLGNTLHRSGFPARLDVVRAVEAPVGCIELRAGAEDLLVAFQGRHQMIRHTV